MEYNVIFERGCAFRVSAETVTDAYAKVREQHPECLMWDLLRVEKVGENNRQQTNSGDISG